jgi:hypothetical protein
MPHASAIGLRLLFAVQHLIHLTDDIESYIVLSMKKTEAAGISPLIARMSRIERMERGKICRMSARAHYNHQTWQDGRNVVRYVPADQVAVLQEAIDGYRLFMQLAQQYADEIIERTRRQFSRPAASGCSRLGNVPALTHASENV